jgi:hypothetical protein
MSVEALPQEVVFDLPSSLVPHRTYEYRANPSNANSFTTEGGTVSFVLPRLERSFYEANTIYIRGRLSLTYADAAGTDPLNPPVSMTSAGIYSLWSRQNIRTGSGQAIESIQNPAVISNIQMNYGLNPSERIGMAPLTKIAPVASAAGALPSSMGWGLRLNSPAGHNTEIEWAMPLNSILTNCEKFLPAGFDEFVIELTIGQLLNATAGAQNPTFMIHRATQAVTAFTLSDLEICAQVFELSPPTYNQLMAQYPQGVSLKSQSYMYGSGSLPSTAGAGTYDIVYSHKLQSIKQFIMAVSPTNAQEGPLYSGVNPNLSSFNLSINGTTYPQRPVRAVNPSETYAQNQKSFGALMSDLKAGSCPMEFHAIASTAYNPYHDSYRSFANTNTLTEIALRSNKCFFLLDLESINGGKNQLFNGVSTSGSGTSSVIRLEVGATLAPTVHNIHYFSVYDALLKFDPVLGVSVVN